MTERDYVINAPAPTLFEYMDLLDIQAWQLIAKTALTVIGALLAILGTMVGWLGKAALDELKKMRKSVECLNHTVAGLVVTQGTHQESFRAGEQRMDQHDSAIHRIEFDVAVLKQGMREQG